MCSRAFIALIILHTALSFPTQRNHGFGFHRRGPRGTAGVVIARTQKEDSICEFAKHHPWAVEFLKSLASPTTISCAIVSGVVLRSLDKVTDRMGESNKTVTKRWEESNANKCRSETNNSIAASLTLLCWSFGIYLFSKSREVNHACAVFSDDLTGF